MGPDGWRSLIVGKNEGFVKGEGFCTVSKMSGAFPRWASLFVGTEFRSIGLHASESATNRRNVREELALCPGEVVGKNAPVARRQSKFELTPLGNLLCRKRAQGELRQASERQPKRDLFDDPIVCRWIRQTPRPGLPESLHP